MNEDFYQFRKKGIGGSEIAAICGISPWQTPLDVYMLKKNPIPETPKKMLPSQEWGKRLEDPILDAYSEKKGIELKRNVQVIHKDYAFVRANLDAVSHDKVPILIEAKTTDKPFKRDWYIKGEWVIPLYYKTQVAYYAAIINPANIDVAVLFGKDDFNIIEYPRNRAFEEALVKKVIRFWTTHIIPSNPPAPTSPADIDNYTTIAPDSVIEATKEIEEMVTRMKLLKTEVKELEKLKGNLKLYMQSHAYLTSSHGEVLASFKEVYAKRVDTEKLKEANVYHLYTKPSQCKRLLL